ncbi:MAG: glycine cleavage system protein GcvH [Gammaproteobacteria bacterium]|nr:glycine cleavage system protein GcvH [Gammaproteobacteria bacterium]
MRKYSESHEWVDLDGEIATIGISNHAQTLLGDIAFIELPAIAMAFEQGDPIGVIESVKSASDFYAPVGGTVLAINEVIASQPTDLNGHAESTWLLKLQLKNKKDLNRLMTDEKYKKSVQTV